MEQIKPAVKWLSQRDNINAFTGELEAHNQCMVSSFTMMMQWLRDFLIQNKMPSFENYAELTHYIIVGENKDKAQKVRFQSINHAKKLNVMLETKHIPFIFKQANFDYSQLLEYVQKNKRPVLVGTMETSAGHIVVFDGKIQNPYGKPSEIIHTGSCKYVTTQGANLDYTPEFFINMVFREMVGNKTSKINAKRTCWTIEQQ